MDTSDIKRCTPGAVKNGGSSGILGTVPLDGTLLILSLIPSGIGFVLFAYGRKQQRWPQLLAGVLFMAYPYFTPSVTSMSVVGAALGAALWYAVRLGW
jgi:hypothetical protein